MTITGSDMHDSETVEHLRSLGIPVVIGHRGESVQGAGCVIRTAAVHDDNPEIAAAHAAGIPVFERAEAWGAIMRHYPERPVCGGHPRKDHHHLHVHSDFPGRPAGPHGDDRGAPSPLWGAGHRVGKGDTIILESCEYCNSFLSFFPTVAVILNVDADHLDFFKDLEDVKHSFRRFAQLVPEGGAVIADGDDANTMDALKGLEKPMLTFGLEQGDIRTSNLTYEKGVGSFDLIYRGENLGRITLQVPGVHNVRNALAAAGAALQLKVPLCRHSGGAPRLYRGGPPL